MPVCGFAAQLVGTFEQSVSQLLGLSPPKGYLY